MHQCIIRTPERIERLVMSEQPLVGGAALICPGIGATIIRIIITCYSDFIAVIDGWRAWNSKLNEGGDALTLFAFSHISSVKFFFSSCFLSRSQRPKNALCIVAVQQVHQRVISGIGIILAN